MVSAHRDIVVLGDLALGGGATYDPVKYGSALQRLEKSGLITCHPVTGTKLTAAGWEAVFHDVSDLVRVGREARLEVGLSTVDFVVVRYALTLLEQTRTVSPELRYATRNLLQLLQEVVEPDSPGGDERVGG